MNWIKGKNNKLKMGDKIELTKEAVKFYVENINDLCLIHGKKEIGLEDYAMVAGFYHAFLTGHMPKGKVLGYGATDSGPKPWNGKKWIDFKDKKVVRVSVKLKYSTYDVFFAERNLKKI